MEMVSLFDDKLITLKSLSGYQAINFYKNGSNLIGWLDNPDYENADNDLRQFFIAKNYYERDEISGYHFGI